MDAHRSCRAAGHHGPARVLPRLSIPGRKLTARPVPASSTNSTSSRWFCAERPRPVSTLPSVTLTASPQSTRQTVGTATRAAKVNRIEWRAVCGHSSAGELDTPTWSLPDRFRERKPVPVCQTGHYRQCTILRRDNAHPVALAGRQHLGLDSAHQDRIRRLLAEEPFPAAPLRGPLSLDDL